MKLFKANYKLMRCYQKHYEMVFDLWCEELNDNVEIHQSTVFNKIKYKIGVQKQIEEYIISGKEQTLPEWLLFVEAVFNK